MTFFGNIKLNTLLIHSKMLKNRIKEISFLIALMTACCLNATAREFVHPGISYTQGQLDRMKAMVEAKVEPYYTTFQNLLNNEFTRLDRNVKDRGTAIPSGKTQDYIGTDGRCAHDLALIWKITGDRRYADKAVAYLNANNHYTNVGSAGTAALGAGKINLLIEAAELMRLRWMGSHRTAEVQGHADIPLLLQHRGRPYQICQR